MASTPGQQTSVDTAPAASSSVACWVCLEGEAQGPLLHAGCACRGTSGFAHVACLVAAASGQTLTMQQEMDSVPHRVLEDGRRVVHTDDIARHNAAMSDTDPLKHWRLCPTCKTFYTGKMELELARARWLDAGGDFSGAPHEPMWWLQDLQDADRVAAAVMLSKCWPVDDPTGGVAFMQDLLAFMKVFPGEDHPNTLAVKNNMAFNLEELGREEEALPLLESIVVASRSAGDRDLHRLNLIQALQALGFVQIKLGHWAEARANVEEALQHRQLIADCTGEDKEDGKSDTMYALAICVGQIGDFQCSRDLVEASMATALQKFGAGHEISIGRSNFMKVLLEVSTTCPTAVAMAVPSNSVLAHSTTLAKEMTVKCFQGTQGSGRPVVQAFNESVLHKLNCCVAVLTFDDASDRYHCSRGQWTGSIEPAGLTFSDGTAMVIQGLQSAPQWNGRRGIVQEFDAEKGRYILNIKGRAKPLGLKPNCCRLAATVDAVNILPDPELVALRAPANSGAINMQQSMQMLMQLLGPEKAMELMSR